MKITHFLLSYLTLPPPLHFFVVVVTCNICMFSIITSDEERQMVGCNKQQPQHNGYKKEIGGPTNTHEKAKEIG